MLLMVQDFYFPQDPSVLCYDASRLFQIQNRATEEVRCGRSKGTGNGAITKGRASK